MKIVSVFRVDAMGFMAIDSMIRRAHSVNFVKENVMSNQGKFGDYSVCYSLDRYPDGLFYRHISVWLNNGHDDDRSDTTVINAVLDIFGFHFTDSEAYEYKTMKDLAGVAPKDFSARFCLAVPSDLDKSNGVAVHYMEYGETRAKNELQQTIADLILEKHGVYEVTTME